MSRRDRLRRWLWCQAERAFPVWVNERKGFEIQGKYDSRLQDAHQISREAYEREFWRMNCESDVYLGRAEVIKTRRLLAKARRFEVPVADVADVEENWTLDTRGHRYLLERAQDEIRARVVRGRREACEFRLRIIAALTGLIGTAIGLASVLKGL